MQAKEALIKLRSRGAAVRVEFAVLFATFSFEGYITDDFNGDSVLTLAAPKFGKETPPTLVLAGFEMSNFDGDFREDEDGVFLVLDITRPIGDGSANIYRFHLVSSVGKKGVHVN